MTHPESADLASPRQSRWSIKRWLALGLAVTATAVLLGWLFHDVSWPVVGKALRQAKWSWLALGALAYLISCSWRSIRWGILMQASGQSGSFMVRLEAIYLSYAANHVLPSHGGELVRAGYMQRRSLVPFESAIGSIVVERLLDVGVVMVMLLSVLWFGNLSPNAAVHQIRLDWLGVALFGLWLGCLIGAQFPGAIARFCGKVAVVVGLGRWHEGISRAMEKFLGGLSALRQPKRFSRAMLSSLGVWGFNAITYWTGLVAFGVLEPGFSGAVLTESLTALTIALPSTPGYVGSYEAGIRFALDSYGVNLDVIVAYGLAMRLVMLVMPVFVGAIVVLRFGWSGFGGENSSEEKIPDI
jgi:glycosyltransferase 2 family protein